MGLSLIVMKAKILLSSGPGSFHSLTLPLGVGLQQQNLLLAECGELTCSSKSRMHPGRCGSVGWSSIP